MYVSSLIVKTIIFVRAQSSTHNPFAKCYKTEQNNHSPD